MKFKMRNYFFGIMIFILLFSVKIVFAETVTEKFYSELSDGTIYRPSYSNTWEEVRGAEIGEGVIGDYIRSMSGISNTGSFGLNRSFLSFNAYSIPTTATITSATLNLYTQEKDNDFNDGMDWVTVVQTSQANPQDEITVEDFDQCGSVDNPVEGIDLAERKDITDVQVGEYLSFKLNDVGISWIDKENPLTANDNTKGTLFGLREGHDVLDTPVVGGPSMYNFLKFYSSESATATKPYLEVTYTVPDTYSDRIYTEPGDGVVYNATITDWNTVHDSEVGTYIDYSTGRPEYITATRHYSPTGQKMIGRGFLPFDVSEITNQAEILSANLYLYVYGVRNYDDDQNSFVRIVETSQSSTTMLTFEDFDQCGLVDSPVAVAGDVKLSDIAEEKYHKWELNDLGLDLLKNGEFLKLGTREGHDVMDDPINDSSINLNSIGYYTLEHSDINKRPYLQVTYTLPEEEKLDPVILIPGIMGSWNKGGIWQMDPITKTYDALIEAFLEDGYIEGETFYTLPYNWRNDNKQTAELLKHQIDLIKMKESVGKVDLVAHSMGGLIARSYIQSEDYDDDVDQMIFINTPHRGAPEAYLQHSGAYMPGISGGVLKHVFKKESQGAGFGDLIEYIQERIPSLEQLLPDYSYLMEKKHGIWEMRTYPYKTPVNSFLDNLNTIDGVELLKERVRVTGVYSYTDPEKTLSAIKVKKDRYKKDQKWDLGIPTGINMGKDRWQVIGVGDMTVAKSSLEFLHVDIDEMTFLGPNHREIVTKAQTAILTELTGEEPEDYFSKPWPSMKKMLLIAVQCPVDIQVINPEGKIVGQDFVLNVEKNEIDGAFYTGADFEGEFVTIPMPMNGRYTIKIKGTGVGEYTIEMSLLKDGLKEAVKQIRRGHVNDGESEEFMIELFEDKDEVVVIGDDLFAELFADLEEFKASGDISKNTAYIILKKKFEHAEKKYIVYEEEQNVFKKKWLKRQIIFMFGLSEAHLRFFKLRGWVTNDAYEVLVGDIRGIVNEL